MQDNLFRRLVLKGHTVRRIRELCLENGIDLSQTPDHVLVKRMRVILQEEKCIGTS